MSTTIHELTSKMLRDKMDGLRIGRGKQDFTPVYAADGLKPRKPPSVEGLHLFTPEQLLTLRVEPLELNGTLVGYQREFQQVHVRGMGKSMLEGKPFPPIIVALDGRGRHYIVEGQHRAAAGVLARVPVEGVIKRMTKDDQALLFSLQSRAKPLDRGLLTLTGTGLFERYVQAALVDNNHAWHDIVSVSRTSKTRISPYTMLRLLIRYVGNVEGHAAKLSTNIDDRWDQGLADELAPLIACFGNKQSNPLAFKPVYLNAIGAAAMHVFRRNDPKPDDYERWTRHMPEFQFKNWVFIHAQLQMTEQLIRHWNKGLSRSRKIEY